MGPAVTRFAPGDRVLVPASVGCGRCAPCGRGVVFLCENFGEGGVYGWATLGGCQAEAIAVPAADMNLMTMPDGMSDDAALVLTDNAPTGWYGAASAASPRRRGGGGRPRPVGLMAAASALIMGASRVLAVDLVEYRALAAGLENGPGGGRPRSEVLALTGGRGADVVIEAVGADATIGLATDLAGRCGQVSVVGVSQSPTYSFNMLMAQLKCLEFTIGLCSVQAELPALGIPLTTSGRLDPGAIITHRFPLEAGPDAYALFASRADGVAKVVLDLPTD